MNITIGKGIKWSEVRSKNWVLSWKIGTAMSGGLKRSFYGWSFGCFLGGVMFTRLVTA